MYLFICLGISEGSQDNINLVIYKLFARVKENLESKMPSDSDVYIFAEVIDFYHRTFRPFKMIDTMFQLVDQSILLFFLLLKLL